MPASILYSSDAFQWIDVLNLKKEEIPVISEQYNINHLLLEDCIDPNHLPKFEDLGNIKFFLTRFNNSTERSSLNTISDVSTKLGIFVKENLLLTVHRIENTASQKIVAALQEKRMPNHSPHLVALELAKEIFVSFELENEHLLDQLDKMENDIFLKNISSSAQLRKLYHFKRKIGLNLKVLNLSSDWVNSFDKMPLAEVEIKDLKDSYRDAISDFDHLYTQSNNIISLYLALSDQKANQVMKTLAIYSVYFLPITFIAGVYGMNFDYMPELKHPYGYFLPWVSC